MAKVKAETTSTKLSKEMKADIEKMIEKIQKRTDKRFAAIENQLEKLKGGGSKANTKKSGTKATPAKAKKKGATKKKTNVEEAE
jgi:flagellar motor switch protein FliG